MHVYVLVITHNAQITAPDYLPAITGWSLLPGGVQKE